MLRSNPKIPVVKGQVVNLLEDWEGTRKVHFYPSSFMEGRSNDLKTSVHPDGTFELELPDGFPALEVWFAFNESHCFYLWLDGDLTITIDFAQMEGKAPPLPCYR
jgi:hypothetical protein